ncbi:hypothetical protein U1Q18_012270 [Sarracenia purpurea var. burkii]
MLLLAVQDPVARTDKPVPQRVWNAPAVPISIPVVITATCDCRAVVGAWLSGGGRRWDGSTAVVRWRHSPGVAHSSLFDFSILYLVRPNQNSPSIGDPDVRSQRGLAVLAVLLGARDVLLSDQVRAARRKGMCCPTTCRGSGVQVDSKFQVGNRSLTFEGALGGSVGRC